MTEAVDENTSDGFHTFRELYDHRIALFITLMRSHPEISWAALAHDDGTVMDGFFLAGIQLPTGDISYHLPNSVAHCMNGFWVLNAPKWDGHTSADVVDRLSRWQP